METELPNASQISFVPPICERWSQGCCFLKQSSIALTTISKVHDMASEHAMNGTKRFGAEHFTPEESTYLQHVLAKQLGPEWVSQRPGPAGGMHMLWGLIFRWENEADNC